MPYPRKYDYDLILSLWREGKTTVEIGRIVCPDVARPHRTIGFILRTHFKIDLSEENRRKYFGTAEAYPKEEVALWKKMRPTHTVMAIFRERQKVIPRLSYSAVHRYIGEMPGPKCWKYIKGHQRLEAKRLYQTYGWHITDICLRLGFSDSTIRKYIGEMDPLSAPARKRQPNYRIHATMEQIARECLPRKAA